MYIQYAKIWEWELFFCHIVTYLYIIIYITQVIVVQLKSPQAVNNWAAVQTS